MSTKHLLIFLMISSMWLTGCNLLVTSEKEDKRDNDSSINPTNLETLKTLGLNPDNVEDRKDPDGKIVSDTENPLGNYNITINQFDEIYGAGINDSPFIYSNYNASSNLYATGLENLYYHEMPKKVAMADVDGDGLDEIFNLILFVPSTVEGSSAFFQCMLIDDVLNPGINSYDIDIIPSTYPGNTGYGGYGGMIDYYAFFDVLGAQLDDDPAEEIIITAHDTIYLLDDKNHNFEILNSKNMKYGEAEDAFWLNAVAEDFNGDGIDEIITGAGMNINISAKYTFMKNDLSVIESDLIAIGESDNTKMKTAFVTTGNFDGDNKIDVLFSGNTYAGTPMIWGFEVDPETLNIIETETIYFVNNTSFDGSDVDIDGYGGNMYYPMTAVNLDGGSQDYLIISNEILKYDLSTEVFVEPFGNCALTNGNTGDQIYADQFISGNFDGNTEGREQIVFIKNYEGVLPNELRGVSYNLQSSSLEYKYYISQINDPFNGFPVIAGGNYDNDSPVIRYTGKHELVLSDPVVIAALAGSPYYGDIGYDGFNENAATTYGTNTTKTGTTSNAVGFSVGVSFGYKKTFDVFGIEIASIEFKTSLENSFEWEFSNSASISTGIQYSTSIQDAVVLTTVPYDIYYYTILSSPESDEIGEEMYISMPRKPIKSIVGKNFYNSNNGDYPDVNVFEHTLGVPSSYTMAESNADDPFNFTYDEFSSLSSSDGGAGGQMITQDITLGTSSEKTFSYDLEVKVEVEGTVMDFSAGVSAGVSYGHTYSTETSMETLFGGSVTNIPADQYDSSKHAFDWKVAVYNYKDSGQTYTVVDYLVNNAK